MIKKLAFYTLYALIAISFYLGFGLENITFSIDWGNPGFEVVCYTPIGLKIKQITTIALIAILFLPIVGQVVRDKNAGTKIKVGHIVISYIIAFVLIWFLFFAINPFAWMSQQVFLFLNDHVVKMQYWVMDI